jgi:hypothetical protein
MIRGLKILAISIMVEKYDKYENNHNCATNLSENAVNLREIHNYSFDIEKQSIISGVKHFCRTSITSTIAIRKLILNTMEYSQYIFNNDYDFNLKFIGNRESYILMLRKTSRSKQSKYS